MRPIRVHLLTIVLGAMLPGALLTGHPGLARYLEGRRIQPTRPGWFTILLLSVDGRQLVSTRVPWGTPLLSIAEPDSLQRLNGLTPAGGRGHSLAPARRPGFQAGGTTSEQRGA